MESLINRGFYIKPQNQTKSIEYINLVVYVVVKICDKFRPPEFKLENDFLLKFYDDKS